jgi:hypothetical protein
VGTGWRVDQLRLIATALLGTVDIVPEPDGLAADFESMMATSMTKEVASVTLRIWTPQHATVRFVRQVGPAIADLTGMRVQSSAQAGDYPTGAWGPEVRDYHVCVEVEPAAPGREMLAARVSLLDSSDAGGDALATALIRAVWTADEARSARIDRHVAHYTGQADLAQAIHDGLEARKAGHEDLATGLLGRAVALADGSGNEDTARLLRNVVDVIDPATGTVRLKPAAVADEMMLDTRSTKTVRVKT